MLAELCVCVVCAWGGDLPFCCFAFISRAVSGPLCHISINCLERRDQLIESDEPDSVSICLIKCFTDTEQTSPDVVGQNTSVELPCGCFRH